MQWIETSGKDLQEAIESALFQLGISRQELEFTVVSEPRRGILGLMKGEARIRARVKPATFSVKENSGRRSRSSDKKGGKKSTGESSTGKKGGAKQKATTKSTTGKDSTGSGRSSSRSNANGSEKSEGGRSPAKKSDTGKATAKASSGGTAKKKGATTTTSRRKTGQAGPAAKDEATSDEERGSVKSPTSSEGDKVYDADALKEQGRVAGEFIEGLLEAFGLSGTVDVVGPEDEAVIVRVTGDDLGLLIGPKASTLTAIQDLTRSIAHRRTDPTSGRLVVDIGGYREKRRAALETFARRIAGEVSKSGQARELEAMVPADRKVIHDSVNSISGVATRSEGVEPNRRVVIEPAS